MLLIITHMFHISDFEAFMNFGRGDFILVFKAFRKI